MGIIISKATLARLSFWGILGDFRRPCSEMNLEETTLHGRTQGPHHLLLKRPRKDLQWSSPTVLLSRGVKSHSRAEVHLFWRAAGRRSRERQRASSAGHNFVPSGMSLALPRMPTGTTIFVLFVYFKDFWAKLRFVTRQVSNPSVCDLE